MKKCGLAFLIVAFTFSGFARAADFDFRCDKKRVDAERSTTASTQISNETWKYHVLIENKSFKDQEKLELHYAIFSKCEVAGSKTGAAKQSKVTGKKEIEKLRNTEKFEFDTESVDLNKTQLIGGWYYGNGAKPRARASITGIWIRLLKDGAVIAEYSEPANLKSKQKWDDDAGGKH
ncbi:MAG: hypothetical protein M3O82_09095 [Verrucomicrobiota bacterium]|nr:hypothetical protein [Verrucomicrobiota bacterium]